MTDQQAGDCCDRIIHMFCRWYNLKTTDQEIIQFRCAIRSMIEDAMREKERD